MIMLTDSNHDYGHAYDGASQDYNDFDKMMTKLGPIACMIMLTMTIIMIMIMAVLQYLHLPIFFWVGFWWDGHYGPENSDFVSVVMFLRHFGQTVDTESGPKRILFNCSRSKSKGGNW